VWLRDPCKDAKRLFRESVRNTVFKGSGESTTGVVFDTSIPLIVDIGFFLQVPQYMFVNNDRHQGRIKPERFRVGQQSQIWTIWTSLFLMLYKV
jgi:hypothetical protein